MLSMNIIKITSSIADNVRAKYDIWRLSCTLSGKVLYYNVQRVSHVGTGGTGTWTSYSQRTQNNLHWGTHTENAMTEEKHVFGRRTLIASWMDEVDLG